MTVNSCIHTYIITSRRSHQKQERIAAVSVSVSVFIHRSVHRDFPLTDSLQPTRASSSLPVPTCYRPERQLPNLSRLPQLSLRCGFLSGQRLHINPSISSFTFSPVRQQSRPPNRELLPNRARDKHLPSPPLSTPQLNKMSCKLPVVVTPPESRVLLQSNTCLLKLLLFIYSYICYSNWNVFVPANCFFLVCSLQHVESAARPAREL